MAENGLMNLHINSMMTNMRLSRKLEMAMTCGTVQID